MIVVSCDILGTGRGVIALSNVREPTVWTRRLSTCQGKLRRRHQGRCDLDSGRDSREWAVEIACWAARPHIMKRAPYVSLHSVSPLTNQDQPKAHSARDSSQNAGLIAATGASWRKAK